MKNFGKRITGFLLAFIMAFDFSVPTFSMELSEVFEEELYGETETFAVSEDGSLEDIIREQVETFAKSIDQENADGKAKDIIVNHGLFKGGKKLSAGKSHALTATLFNSELLKACITDSFAGIIKTANRLHEEEMYGYIQCSWVAGKKYRYYGYVLNYDYEVFENGNYITNIKNVNYSGKTSSYDSALELIAGSTDVEISVENIKISKTEVTYKVTCTVADCFDFDASAGLISGIGAFLFTPFDWESTVSFNLKVPYSCSHVTHSYGWNYDAENHTLNSVFEEEFESNIAKQMVITNDNGKKAYYYELDEPVNLFHDKPWVMEYTVINPGQFSIAPMDRGQYHYPFLVNMGKNHLFFQDYEIINGKRLNNCYGLSFGNYFAIYPEQSYTLTLKNFVETNGENMIFLSVFNNTQQKTVLAPIPMDDHYYMENGVLDLQSKESEKLSGKDFIINYIGNKQYAFYATYFDLRIWENGKDSESASCFEAGKTTAPTCTEKGYTTYTCSLCGYSKKADYTAALGHSLGEWETVTAPTAENPGEEQRKCKNCEHSESRVIPALGYTLSDINLDGSVDVMDAYFIRLVVAKLVEPTAKQIEIGDVDLDGKITAIDANIIRKYAIGIIKNLPIE